jgi:hypothetical protein
MEMALGEEHTKKNKHLFRKLYFSHFEDMNCNRQITLSNPNHQEESVSVD